jgi:membrane-associated protease RseP (regulator of RpoE activity)
MTAAQVEPPRRQRYLLHISLFLITFLTTTAAGALYVHGQAMGGPSGWRAIFPITDGLAYSVPLLLILLSHEFGHFFVARAHGVDASLPFFIPLPPIFILGTMGAVISMRSSEDRKKLIDIGAAGPLCGLLVAIPVILYGLSLSKVGDMAGGYQEGNSLLYGLLKLMAKGAWLPDGRQDVFLHPTAWAGWAGLLVTMINLLPIGQLDGGHIATAYFGNGYQRFARTLHRLLPLGAITVFFWVFYLVRQEMSQSGLGWSRSIALGIAGGAALPWLVWFAMVAVIKRLSGGFDHPPVDDQPLPASRRLLFWVMVVVFVGIFMPVPFRAIMVGSAP